jgi:phosphoribosylformylglycinamidine cyclo-ligase
VGVVDRSHLIDGSKVRPGDVLVGLLSSGLHTNGYSLARSVLLDHAGLRVSDSVPGLRNSVGKELLKVHRDYSQVIHRLSTHDLITGAAHITGGGFEGNLPRILPDTADAVVRIRSWAVPRIFTIIQELGQISDAEMLRTFNMGVGIVLTVRPEKLDKVRAALRGFRTPHRTIGEVRRGRRRVVFS